MRDRSELKSPGIMGGDAAAADVLRGEFDLKNMQLFCHESTIDLCFFGDSITNLLEPGAFYGHFGTCINRGISGDSVHIMAKRFEADVLQLKPRLCVMLGGINNTWILDDTVDEKGKPPADKVEEVYRLVRESYISVLEAAKKAGQAMILCSVTPVTRQIALADMRNEVVLGMNRIIRELCEKYRVPYADYHSRFVREDGRTMRDGLSDDGLHPHYGGYLVMSEVLTPLLKEYFQA